MIALILACTFPHPWSNPFSPDLPVDINHDCVIDVQDMTMVLLAWGPSEYGMCCDGIMRPTAPTDINRDGMTDISDLQAVLAHWGQEDLD